MRTDSPPRIEQLSASVINKIAAGEVIERPASVVKELLENAVDAESTHIEVKLEKGGADLIRVTDNGWGIDPTQLTLAVASHATSKIRSADDLFAVSTLGFRGEALASIGEVSRLRIRSKIVAADSGHELNVDGGKLNEVTPCACGQGTSVEVRNLFFNTPVRRKFMRTTQTELGHATEAFIRIALAQPQIHFSLLHHERALHDLPAVSDWRERIAEIFGRELGDALMWVESDDGHLRLSGYVANPAHSRSNNKMQYLFLNGRHIKDRALQHALSESYRGLLMTGRYPISFLRFEMAADQIDVNVHPCKLEVRFRDAGRLYSQLLGTLRTRFLSTDLTARVEPQPREQADEAAIDARQAAEVRDRVVQWARGGAASTNSEELRSPAPERQSGFRFDPPRPETPLRLSDQPLDRGQSAPSVRSPSPRLQALQAHDRYLVTACDEGLIIIDQHALHERIIYEQLRERAEEGQIEVQQLLTPEPVDLSPSEAAAVLESQAVLRDLGIHIEPFGGDTVLIAGYPSVLRGIDPVELVRQIATQLVQGDAKPQRRDLFDELLHMMSCKAAIKAGDRLSGEEIATLVEQRHLVQDAHHCPHGRPTTLVFTRDELDRQFKRI